MSDIEKPDTIGAHRRAETIRDGMRGWAAAQEAIAEAFEQRDWITLGYKSWDQYIEKEFAERRLKLSKAQRVEAVEAFQLLGMSQRQMAHTLGVSRNTIAGDLAPEVAQSEPPTEQVGVSDPRPTGQEGPVETPLGGSSTQTAAEQGAGEHVLPADGVEVEQHPTVDTPAPAGGVEQSPPAGVTPNGEEVAGWRADENSRLANETAGRNGGVSNPGAATQDSPVAETSASASTGSARTGRDEAEAPQQPGSNSLTGQPHASDMPEGEPPTATGQSGIYHPSATGEAPADLEESASGAGVTPSDVGEASGDETAGAGLPAPGLASAVDQPIASPEELKKLIDEWLDVLDRRVEYAVLAPQYDEDSLLDLELQVEGFARMVGLMRRWYEEEQA